ncbi:uncharacterized protein [Euwallacea fornicatus]|uniref:uncharacterized protein isoform X5 n=1 Tax=Euwallacea fornicatus TaxID=995702 RepID=UPI00338EE628
MDILPCEIWEEVVKNLTALDLINFCKSSDEFLFLLRGKNVVINFDLGGCFAAHKEQLYKQISQEVAYEYIKRLNINKLYWLTLEEIRDIVRLLPHLEELRALDTILGMRNEDVNLYRKLKKLAISVEADQFTSPRELYRDNLSNLRSLCIKFVTKYRADFRRIYYMFFNELRKLDDLWIYDADDVEVQSLRYDYIVCNLRNLQTLVIKSKTNLTLLDYQPFGLLKIYERRRSNITTICYVLSVKLEVLQLNNRKRSLSEVFESRTEKSWNVVHSFLTEIPCTLKTSLHIYKSKSIKNLDFNELSFYHTRVCNSTFINAVIDILLSKRSRSLKKLCLTFCVLQGNIEIRLINSLIYRKFNILEGNVDQTEKQNVFRHVINNCRHLTDLEIVSCLNNDKMEVDEIPFRVPWFESIHIDLDRLFSAFNRVLSSKLQRVVIKCDYEHSSQLWPLEKLLRRNNELILLVILVAKYNRHQIARLQDLLNERVDCPAKIYVAKTAMAPGDDLAIPEAHKDIVYFDSNISVLHFSDF